MMTNRNNILRHQRHPSGDQQQHENDDAVDIVTSIQASMSADNNDNDNRNAIVVEEHSPNTPRQTPPSLSSYHYYYNTFWSIYSIAICAFLGAVTRAYLAHYLQCDTASSSTVCVTSTQSALFVDLPANLLGCFVMGILWQSQNLTHHHDAVPFYTAWQVGFCGSLTTFSSWNMQMVILLEQKEIVTAVLGYILGTCGAYGSFVLGTALFLMTTTSSSSTRRSQDDDMNTNIHEHSSDDSSSSRTSTRKQTYPQELWLIPPTLLTCGLLLFFLTATSTVSPVSSSLAPLIWTAPAGALTRYYLAIRYNNTTTTTTTTARIPMRGTLMANWMACILLALLTGLDRPIKHNMTPWTVGYLGSLSTVSSWIKEIHCHTPPSNWIYAAVTLGGAMLLSLILYLPLHRFV